MDVQLPLVAYYIYNCMYFALWVRNDVLSSYDFDQYFECLMH